MQNTWIYSAAWFKLDMDLEPSIYNYLRSVAGECRPQLQHRGNYGTMAMASLVIPKLALPGSSASTCNSIDPAAVTGTSA